MWEQINNGEISTPQLDRAAAAAAAASAGAAVAPPSAHSLWHNTPSGAMPAPVMPAAEITGAHAPMPVMSSMTPARNGVAEPAPAMAAASPAAAPVAAAAGSSPT